MNEADEFLRQKDLFQLGELPTETPHPLTVNLSRLSREDLHEALRILHEIDIQALNKTLGRLGELGPLFESVAETLAAGHRIFLVGCGATGRLSLSLEYLWRRRHPDSDQVRSLMAGGDVALVHSLEGFEDFPEYGARHLRQLGFGPHDLLIATTEGGETPYVIGATEAAAEISDRQPFFLYCNSREILITKVERSRRVLQNTEIRSICLEVGPMALTGSTRMQASTVLMLAVGLALEHGRDIQAAGHQLRAWISHFERAGSQCGFLKNFIESESAVYESGDHTLYSAEDLAITVFTDTTERAPTFNLAPFDSPLFPSPKHSLTYIMIPSAPDALSSWRLLLSRDPRPLEWPEVHPKTSREYLLSFDFGQKAKNFRAELTPGHAHHVFEILKAGRELNFRFHGLTARFELGAESELFDHLILKMLLNRHSTLVMGRLGRYESNLMTWVYPSNGKLVDRAARYTRILLAQKGHTEFTYEQIVRAQFECKKNLSPKESIVHKTMERLLSERNQSPGSHARR